MGNFARGLCYWRSLLEQSQGQIKQLKAKKPQMYCEVKYEELVRDPAHVLDDLADFLDIVPSEQTASVRAMLENQKTVSQPTYPIEQVPESEKKRVIKILDMFNYPTSALK
jgi:LPS sulfotransferase NodH